MDGVPHRKWQNLLGAWAVAPTLAEAMFEEVLKQYAGPGRFYHTLDHVGAILETAENLGSFARKSNPNSGTARRLGAFPQIAAFIH